MPLVHFDLPAIFRCAVDFGRVLEENLPQIEAIDTPEECFTSKPDEDALETAHVRLIRAFLPYQDPELVDLLIRDLTIPPDIPAKGMPTPEVCARMAAGSRLLRDCDCAAEGPEAGSALLALAQVLMEWLHHEDARNWLAKFGEIVWRVWAAIPEVERRKLTSEYQLACEVWDWPTVRDESLSATPDDLLIARLEQQEQARREAARRQDELISLAQRVHELRDKIAYYGETAATKDIASLSELAALIVEFLQAVVAVGAGDRIQALKPDDSAAKECAIEIYRRCAEDDGKGAAELMGRALQTDDGSAVLDWIKRRLPNEICARPTNPWQGLIDRCEGLVGATLIIPKPAGFVQQVTDLWEHAWRIAEYGHEPPHQPTLPGTVDELRQGIANLRAWAVQQQQVEQAGTVGAADQANAGQREAAGESSNDATLTCANCGGPLCDEERGRWCPACRSREGKLIEIAIALQTNPDSLDHLREWPKIHHFACEFFTHPSFTIDTLNRLKTWLKAVHNKTDPLEIESREVAALLQAACEQRTERHAPTETSVGGTANQAGARRGEGVAKPMKPKRKGGRRELAETDPKRQVYERIRRESKTGEKAATIQRRLEDDKDFIALFKAAKLKWKTVFKNARAYFGQPGKKQETPPT